MIEIALNTKKNLFIRMDRATAITLIASLAKQISSNDMNTHRMEEYTNNGIDFSVAVIPEERFEAKSLNIKYPLRKDETM